MFLKIFFFYSQFFCHFIVFLFILVLLIFISVLDILVHQNEIKTRIVEIFEVIKMCFSSF